MTIRLVARKDAGIRVREVAAASVILWVSAAIAEPAPVAPFSLTYASIERENVPATQPAGEAGEEAKQAAAGASSSEDLAKKLQNPVADLISVPFQFNFDSGGGVDIPSGFGRGFLARVLPRGPARLASRVLNFALRDEPDRDQASKYLLNFQPAVPIILNDEWNVISRTILPVVYQDDVLGVSSQGGLGDILQSLFFSPKSASPRPPPGHLATARFGPTPWRLWQRRSNSTATALLLSDGCAYHKRRVRSSDDLDSTIPL